MKEAFTQIGDFHLNIGTQIKQKLGSSHQRKEVVQLSSNIFGTLEVASY